MYNKKFLPQKIKLFKSVTVFSLLFFIVAIPFTADAQKKYQIYDDNMQAEIVPRLGIDKADAAVVTKDNNVELLLSGDNIILQFTDKKLVMIEREIRDDANNDESHFVNVLLTMVSSGVRTLLDRGLAIPLNEISEISYSNNRLIIRNLEGKEIFSDVDIDDKPVMEQFPRRDALKFISEAESRMI